MRIGVDFDNTLANYDALFATLATESELVPDLPGWPPVQKTVLRDCLRAVKGGEEEWQRLQALAYGPRLKDATLMPHAEEFLRQCGARQIEVTIVSHKTQFAACKDVGDDLRKAAMDWMSDHGFFGALGLSPDRVIFEDDCAAKVARIAELDVTYFVDDLEEVLRHPKFPDSVVALLFDPKGAAKSGPYHTMRIWNEIAEVCFSHEFVQ
jgi:hypothetical protein